MTLALAIANPNPNPNPNPICVDNSVAFQSPRPSLHGRSVSTDDHSTFFFIEKNCQQLVERQTR